MAILEKPKTKGITIDLTGPQGNAFYLLGTANNLAKQLDLNVVEIINEMKSGDYENLINVFDKNFGMFVTLYRQYLQKNKKMEDLIQYMNVNTSYNFLKNIIIKVKLYFFDYYEEIHKNMCI